jgi:2-C-methyl-D-erythritol 2,4-cyclodiphosphate synthase
MFTVWSGDMRWCSAVSMFRHRQGSITHSDGDVLSHALVDALAGAIADGDSGRTSQRMTRRRTRRSLDFVRHLVRLVRADGYKIANVDSFVVLGTTRLRPHLDGMRRNCSEITFRPCLGAGRWTRSTRRRSGRGGSGCSMIVVRRSSW